MLFDFTHVLYMVISTICIILFLVLAHRFIVSEGGREAFLKTVATVTVIIHYSNIWVEFFGNGGSTAGLEGSHLFPVYPCHIMMWLFFVTAFMKNKRGTAFKLLADFCFFVGIVCATFGVVLNMNYADNPTLADWSVLKGLLSHSTLILGCAYLRIGGFMKIRMSNLFGCVAGFLIFLLDGLFVNWLYELCGLPEVNAMFLLYSPFENMPWLSIYTMGVLGFVFLFTILCIYEFFIPKEERWYVKLEDWIYKIKERIISK